jgi:glutamate--cysteine ligase
LSRLEDRLNHLLPETLRTLQRGLEKESLRVTPDGQLARDPHPAALGSPLTHPQITTDFSESQVELITGVHQSIAGCLRQLTEVHQVVCRHIGDQMLWCTSMPCLLPPDDEIPIGQYGSSNIGRIKTVYRTGLKHRYGSRMQTISGLHYNFSLPAGAWADLQAADGDRGTALDYRNAAYFSLIRSFRRHSWLLLYLFGASPTVCRSFVEGRPHRLKELNETTLFMPHATSLRMGPLGYQSDAQSTLGVSYNCLRSYAESLREALSQPYPPYEAIGLRRGDEYLQRSTTLLQIENEFYGTIRPKQPIRPGERPLHALAERGVEYVEVRLMDLDPFSPIGITADTIRFLDIFLLHCLLGDSPPDSPAMIELLSRNRHEVAERGRDPALMLTRDHGGQVGLAQWGGELLDECEAIAAALDAAHGDTSQGAGLYRRSLATAREKLSNPSLTPSARVLEALEQTAGGASSLSFALAQSMQHQRELTSLTLPEELRQRYQQMAADSIAARRAIESADVLAFEDFRRHYLAQPLLVI